jgi:hypothetical protein
MVTSSSSRQRQNKSIKHKNHISTAVATKYGDDSDDDEFRTASDSVATNYQSATTTTDTRPTTARSDSVVTAKTALPTTKTTTSRSDSIATAKTAIPATTTTARSDSVVVLSSVSTNGRRSPRAPESASATTSAATERDDDSVVVSTNDWSPATTTTVKPDLKKANCFRTVENWSHIASYHRFDKNTFDKEKFLEDIPKMSPKMLEMINTIKKLDEHDLINEGKRFKHFIFSDVKQRGYGAKIIASALVAHGFSHCFTNSLSVKKPTPNQNEQTFGLVSSTAVYDKPMTQKKVRQVLDMFNKRPNNVNGQDMRFIVLDSGFKEGIDLFDVKYVHIFENQRTGADLIQAVGRATRSCGQQGLNFVPNEGWLLHVYQYYLTYAADHTDTDTDIEQTLPFNDYLHYAGVNMNLYQFRNNLERLAIRTAVDHHLNRHIHNYQQKVDTNGNLLQLNHVDVDVDVDVDVKTSGGGATTIHIGCNEKATCGNRSTKTVPFSLKLFNSVFDKKKLPKGFRKLPTKEKRRYFCDILRTDSEFCRTVNELYRSQHDNGNKSKPKSGDKSDDKDKDQTKIVTLSRMKTDISFDKLENMSFEAFQTHINKVFRKYQYDPIKIHNDCGTQPSGNKDHRVVELTKSQSFVTNYFVPQHFAKGLLVWHSVGTGKTCTAISVKSFLFERQDYSVVWVTRTTLKEDIWKNMYDKICDHIIREKYTGTQEAKDLRKHLSKRFFPPMSYRQFSNMLEGKNQLHEKLMALNGAKDLLRNTLVIIDEAHKLYGNDLAAVEKPNMKIIEEKINMSATCKLLLMTGTPITDDPMDFVRLLNLIMKANKLPTSFPQFNKQFLLHNTFTKNGVKEFQSRTKGLISYLNRRFDPRQFAQPVFHSRPVLLSISKNDPGKCMEDAKSKFARCLDKKELSDDSRLKNLIEEQKTLTFNLRNDRDDLKYDKRNVVLQDRIRLNRLDLQVVKDYISQERIRLRQIQKSFNGNKKICKRELSKEQKECKTRSNSDLYYQNIAFKKC